MDWKKEGLPSLFGSFQRELDQFLTHSFREMEEWFQSRYEVEMGEKEVVIRVKIPPSVGREQIRYTIHDGHLFVRWKERVEEKVEDERRGLVQMRSRQGQMEQMIPLPEGAVGRVTDLEMKKGEILFHVPRR